jgi:hypothetical protein
VAAVGTGRRDQVSGMRPQFLSCLLGGLDLSLELCGNASEVEEAAKVTEKHFPNPRKDRAGDLPNP